MMPDDLGIDPDISTPSGEGRSGWLIILPAILFLLLFVGAVLLVAQ